MRRVLLVLCLALVVLAPGRAAVAEKRPQFITLVGSQTSYIDVRFDEKFKLDEWSTELSYKGDFAGWVIRRLREPIDLDHGNLTGAYAIRDVGSPGSPPYVLTVGLRAFQDRALALGLYRVYLIADGPAKVQIPIVEGTEARTIRPLRATTARATSTELEVNAIGAAPRATNYSPVRVADDMLSASITYFHAEPGATVQDVQACMTKERDEPLQNCEGGGIAGQVLHPTETYDFSLSSWYEPGTLEPGGYYAFHKVTAATVERVVGAYLTLRIGKA